MPPGRKKDIGLTSRRQQVVELYLQGYRQWQIAERTLTDQATVSRDIKHVREEWLNRAVGDYNELLNREIEAIAQLQVTYRQAWERSLRKKARRTIRTVPVSKQSNETVDKEVERTTEQSYGDPRYLQGIQWCIEMRCKLEGLLKADPGQTLLTERPYLVVEGIDVGLATGTTPAGPAAGAAGGEVIEGKLALPPADAEQGGKKP